MLSGSASLIEMIYCVPPFSLTEFAMLLACDWLRERRVVILETPRLASPASKPAATARSLAFAALSSAAAAASFASAPFWSAIAAASRASAAFWSATAAAASATAASLRATSAAALAAAARSSACLAFVSASAIRAVASVLYFCNSFSLSFCAAVVTLHRVAVRTNVSSNEARYAKFVMVSQSVIGIPSMVPLWFFLLFLAGMLGVGIWVAIAAVGDVRRRRARNRDLP